MGTPSIGSAAQMALDMTSTFSSSSKWLEFNSESLARQGVVVAADAAIRGTRSRSQERTRTGAYKCGGTVSINCDINNMDALLAYVLGSGPASHVYSLAETLPSFYLLVDRGAKVFTYGPCYVSKATFSASHQSPMLVCTLDVEAEAETVGDSGTFPTGMTVDTNRPYIYSDLTWTIGGAAYSGFDFQLTVDNHLLADRFVNELTRSQIPAVDREVTARLTTPWTSTETPLYGITPGSFGALLATFANAEETISSTQSQLIFDAPCFEYPIHSPVITGKANEIHLSLAGICRKTGTMPELTITNTHG